MLLLILMSVFVPLRAERCSINKGEVSNEAYRKLVASQQQFSADLLHTISSLHPSDNVFFSPSSVYNALLLAYFVSAGHTEQVLKTALHIPNSQVKDNVVGGYFQLKKYQNDLKSEKEKNKKNYELSNANRIYVSDKLPVRKCVKELFGEECHLINFVENTNKAIKEINEWVAKQTANVIKDLFAPNSLSPATQLAIVNAAYFKGFWQAKFPKQNTHQANFYLANGTTKPVTMMTQKNSFKQMLDGDLGAIIIELPYQDSDISMFIFLPWEWSPSVLPKMVKKLNSKKLAEVVQRLSEEDPIKTTLEIPKFTIEADYDLIPILGSMGVKELFGNSANLSALFENKQSSVFSKAQHKAKILVDEEGTEAAAVTSIFIARSLNEHLKFRADHPFVYTVHDKALNVVMFMGIFNSPEN